MTSSMTSPASLRELINELFESMPEWLGPKLFIAWGMAAQDVNRAVALLFTLMAETGVTDGSSCSQHPY